VVRAAALTRQRSRGQFSMSVRRRRTFCSPRDRLIAQHRRTRSGTGGKRRSHTLRTDVARSWARRCERWRAGPTGWSGSTPGSQRPASSRRPVACLPRCRSSTPSSAATPSGPSSRSSRQPTGSRKPVPGLHGRRRQVSRRAESQHRPASGSPPRRRGRARRRQSRRRPGRRHRCGRSWRGS
jgi:hypothetical protein